jgi:hypothetical protein
LFSQVLFTLALLVASVSAKPTAEAEAKADPFWAINPAVRVYPQVATTPYHTDEEANCHIEFETIMTKFCKPTFQVKCTKEQYPQQTIELEKVCKEIVDVACGLHKHPYPDQSVPAVPSQESSVHIHDVEGNVVTDEATTAVQAGIPYIGGYIPYHLQPQARHHCHNVKRDYCYTVPVVKDVSSEVDNCHVEQGSECSDSEHNVPKWVCKHDPGVAPVEIAQFQVPAAIAPEVVPVAAPVPVAAAPVQFKYVPTQVFYGK